jgi:hypothetical protein
VIEDLFDDIQIVDHLPLGLIAVPHNTLPPVAIQKSPVFVNKL